MLSEGKAELLIMGKAKRKFRNLIFFIIDVFWVGFIFGNSLKDATESSAASKPFSEVLFWIMKQFNSESFFALADYYVRKAAHFAEFFILGLLLFFSFAPKYYHQKKSGKLLIKTIGLGLTICSLDEFLQFFSKGRNPATKDIIIDFCGVATAVIIGSMIFYGKKRRLKKEERKEIEEDEE